MADNNVNIFSGREGYTTQNITATGAWLSWGTAGTDSKSTKPLPLLMSQISMTYSRSIQPIYPVNTGDKNTLIKLQILSAPQGTLQCTGIITPSQELLEDFLYQTGTTCIDHNVVMEFKPFDSHQNKACKNKFGYRMTGLTLQTIGFTVQGNEVAIISQPMAFTFTGLELINIGTAPNTPTPQQGVDFRQVQQ